MPAVLERSRSGDGGYVWVFFADSVPASSAGQIGVFLIREAMTVRAELDLSSYDRLFPAQDFLPRQGLGNLIGLPLQGGCRRRGTTQVLDEQWVTAARKAVCYTAVSRLKSARNRGNQRKVGKC